MIVEDLHWADAASIELLRFLVDRLDERPMMLLLTHRPIFDAAELATSRTSQTAIRLGALTSQDCQALVAGLFSESSGQIPQQLQQFVVERASGNPFYLEEVVRSLIESGALYRDGETWSCSDVVADLDVPLTIQGLLLSRLDRLPSKVRRLTQEASVVGVEFTRGMLEAVCTAPDTIDSALEALRDVELVEELGSAMNGPTAQGAAEQRFKFSHAIVHEVVYHNLLVSRRAKLHSLAGEALEKSAAASPSGWRTSRRWPIISAKAKTRGRACAFSSRPATGRGAFMPTTTRSVITGAPSSALTKPRTTAPSAWQFSNGSAICSARPAPERRRWRSTRPS